MVSSNVQYDVEANSPGTPSLEDSIQKVKLEEEEVPYNPSYFAAYTGFVQDVKSPFSKEFDRLALEKGWAKDTPEFAQHQDAALLREFEHHYQARGRASTGHTPLQQLCKDFGVEPPASNTRCRQALRRTYVNIFDYLDCSRRGEFPVRPTFKTITQLRKYSKKNGKIFPRRAAKSTEILRALLKHMSG